MAGLTLGQGAILQADAVASLPVWQCLAAEGPGTAVFKANYHVVAFGGLDLLLNVIAGKGAADDAGYGRQIPPGSCTHLVTGNTAENAPDNRATTASLGLDRDFVDRLDAAAVRADHRGGQPAGLN